MDKTKISSHLTPLNKSIDWKLASFAFVLSLMVFTRDLDIFSFTPIYFIIVVTIASIILPYRSLQVLFFFLIPFACAIHGICDIPLLTALIFKAPKRNVLQFVFTIIILILEGIHIAVYNFYTDINLYIVYSLSIFLFFYMLFDDNIDNEIICRCIQYYVIGTFVILSVIIIHISLEYGLSSFIIGTTRLSSEGAFLKNTADESMYASLNANNIAYFSITAFSLCLCIKKIFQTDVLKWILMIGFVIAGITSTSRAWFFLMVFLLVLYALLSDLKRKIGFVFAIITFLIMAFYYINITEAVVERFEDRMQNTNLQTAGRRTELFDLYNRFLDENPQYIVFGTGAVYYKEVCKIWNSTHSGIQQIYVCYGVLGFLLFVTICLMFYQRYIRKRKHKLLYYLPLLTCFIFDQSIQFLNPAFLMLPFLATSLPLKNKLK